MKTTLVLSCCVFAFLLVHNGVDCTRSVLQETARAGISVFTTSGSAYASSSSKVEVDGDTVKKTGMIGGIFFALERFAGSA